MRTGKAPEEFGIINQKGLNRKVRGIHECIGAFVLTLLVQHIFDSVKASLSRLQVEYIDVLQCKPLSSF